MKLPFKKIKIVAMIRNTEKKHFTLIKAMNMDDNRALSEMELNFINLNHQKWLSDYYDNVTRIADCGTADREMIDQFQTIMAMGSDNVYEEFLNGLYDDYSGPSFIEDHIRLYFPYKL
jgi:hypothetical protein